jgi:hypothetical protein
MSNNLKTIRDTVGADKIRADGDAIGLGVAITDDELVTARAGLATRGPTVQRFSLNSLTKLRVLPNPHANLVEIEFAGKPPKSVTFMYDARTAKDLEGVVGILRERAANPSVTVAEASASDPQSSEVAADPQPEGEASTTRRNRIIFLLLLLPLIGLYLAQVYLR